MTGFEGKLPLFVTLNNSCSGQAVFSFANRQKGIIASGIVLSIFGIIWNIFTLSMLIFLLVKVNLNFYFATLLIFTPFILLGIYIAGLAVYNIFGKIKFTFSEQSVDIFQGVGNWGRRKQFTYNNIASVSVESTTMPRFNNSYATYSLHLTLIDAREWEINFNNAQAAPMFFKEILDKIILQLKV